jgi:ATP-dependent Clp protease ATP-binding subunit ClpB
VRRRPYSVLLLDEIEKAHPEVFNVLLQMLDDGRLTDGQGRTVDFTNTVVIMTSNLGSQYITDEKARKEEIRERVMAAVRAHFRPEFLNRIDEIVIFDRLTPADLEAIVEIQLRLFARTLASRGLTIELTDAAKQWLAERGFDPIYGARPLKRVLQTHVQNPLAMELLEGTLTEGDHVRVDVAPDGEGLTFEAERAGEETAAPVAADGRR